MKAEKLSDVTSVGEDDGSDMLRTVWDPQGNLAAVKRSAKVPLPMDPEALRFRITLMGTSWIFTSYQQTNREFLKGLHPQVFQEYLDYLLGKNVYGLAARAAGGAVYGGPPWEAILCYEYEIRVNAYRLVHKGMTLKDALKKSYEDPVVKERSFTTPLAFGVIEYARKRPGSDFIQEQEFKKGKQDKGNGKGKKGNAKKGKGGGKLAGCAATTADGKRICFDFNNTGRKCDMGKKCRYMHVCGRCTKEKKPMYECRCDGKTAWAIARASGSVSPPGADAREEIVERKADPATNEVARRTVLPMASDVLRVLYLFSGKVRVDSVASCLKKLGGAKGVKVIVKEVDILRGRRKYNMLSRPKQKAILEQVGEGLYAAVVASPPCSTFSRARSSGKVGPRALRSKDHPRGLPWLSPKERATVRDANVLVDFSVEVLRKQLEVDDAKLVLLEHPEDLGLTRTGAWPSSIWQWQEVRDLLGSSATCWGGSVEAVRLGHQVREADEILGQAAWVGSSPLFGSAAAGQYRQLLGPGAEGSKVA